jgi:hypothetical protein
MATRNKNRSQELAIWLRLYHPQPSEQYYKKMANAPWYQSGQETPIHTKHRLHWATVLLAVVVLLAVSSLAIPDVRAAAISWLGLNRAPSDSMPAESVDITRSIEDAGRLQELSQQAGWTIVSPQYLPEGYTFNSADYDTTNKMVLFSFLATRELPNSNGLTETKQLVFVQALHNDFIPLRVAPSTQVDDVRIGNQPGAYAIGAWDTTYDETTKGMISTWRNDLVIQNLYWQQGNVYLVLISDDDQVSKSDLLKMAASMK